MENEESGFLYPTTDEYTFDKTCLEIIKELKKRGFFVSGISVKFSNHYQYSWISEIKGENFSLGFYRYVFGYPENEKHFAAVENLIIPRNELNVYEDHGGPVFYHYVGKDWKRDKESFSDNCKVNSKLHKRRRIYLKYEGLHRYVNDKATILVSDNDLHREYSPRGSERTEYSMKEIENKFNQWLKKNVLDYIKSLPFS